MELRYPLTSELMTFVHTLNRTIERNLRKECKLSIVQYRAASCMRQAGEIEEAAMKRVMATSASQLSQGLKGLRANGLAQSRRNQGPAKLWLLTPAGHRAIEDADAVLIDACNQVFGPLGSELGSAIRSGSMLTNQRHGIVRIEGGRFFEEHACFEAFLQAERFTKESTQLFGLSESEFRILFELLVNGPASKSTLSKRLIMAPSIVTGACKQLECRALVNTVQNTADRRVQTLAIAAGARELTETVAELIDARTFDDLRPTSVSERELYQRMADIVVSDVR